MNQRMADEENIIDKLGYIPATEMKSPLENLDQAYIDALDSGDNAQRSVIAKLIQAEEQALPGSQVHQQELEDQGYTTGGHGDKILRDAAKGAWQFGVMDTAGIMSRTLPFAGTEDQGSKYYGWNIGDEFTAKDLIPSFLKEGFWPDEHEGGMTMPWSEFTKNELFFNHMLELEEYAANKALKEIHPGLNIRMGKDDIDAGVIKIRDEAIANGDNEMLDKINAFLNQEHAYTSMEGDNIRINFLPEVNEGFFGKDMTQDPRFTSYGDLSLPGAGVWGMRDGELKLLAPPISRPLDEIGRLSEEGSHMGRLGDWLSEYVTKPTAPVGPEMMPPEGVGMGYMLPLAYGLGRGVGWPAAKGAVKAGKTAYKYPKTATGTGLASLPIAKRLFAEEE